MNKNKISKYLRNCFEKVFNEVLKEGDYFKEFKAEVDLYTGSGGLEESIKFSTGNFYHDMQCKCKTCQKDYKTEKQ